MEMTCCKVDQYGESACEFAQVNPMLNNFECTNPCVLMAHKAMLEAKEKWCEAEAKLKKYREAIKPFVANCRAVIDAVESGKNDGENKK